VEVLARGAINRTVIGVMGLNLGVPSEDLKTLVQSSTNPYFTLGDLTVAVRDATGDTSSGERIADQSDIAQSFYFGEYTKKEYLHSMEQATGAEG
jgi:hypothetical protein